MVGVGTVLGNRWVVGKFVGEGACAKVYSVTDSKSPLEYDVVAKVIALPKSTGKKDKEQERICNTLNYENMLYVGLLIDFPHCPRRPAKFYGDDLDARVRYLVMERLEVDLVGYAASNAISISQLAEFGLQILEGLQLLHRKNFIFVDVKPENFMLKNGKLYFVDFGLVERYVSQDAVNARAPGTRAAFAGTPTFCSLSVHKGGIPTAPDDVEAMCYVLLSLFSGGKMPWSAAKSDQDCIRQKETCDIDRLATERHCPELGQIVGLCRRLRSGQAVDYQACNQLLNQMKNRKGAGVPSAGVASSTSKAASPRKAARAPKKGIEVLDLDEEDTVGELPVAAPAPAKKSRVASTPVLPSAAVKLPATVFNLTGGEGRLSEGPFSSVRETRSKSSPVKASRASAPAAESAPVPSTSSSSSAAKSRTKSAHDEPFSTASPGKKASASHAPPAANNLKGRYWFEVTKGPHSGERLVIGPHDDKRAPVLMKNLGRGDYCELLLEEDEFLSECHLIVKITKQRLYVKDNSSTNGSEVNGDKLLPKKWIEVLEGSMISVGETDLHVRN